MTKYKVTVEKIVVYEFEINSLNQEEAFYDAKIFFSKMRKREEKIIEENEIYQIDEIGN